jgi:hypothetical protein
MVAGVIALVSARPLPEDCTGVIAHNSIPEEVNVTSYYGNGTVKESFIIPAHYDGAPGDAVQISVPKDGRIVCEGYNYILAQTEKAII